MLKILTLALTLLLASVGAASAGYLWKGDTVHVSYPCSDKAGIMEMSEAYIVSQSEGNAAWAALVETGRCYKTELREYTLGERVGQYSLANGLQVGVWEVLRDGKTLWAGFIHDSGDHDTPYKSDDERSGFLWKGDEMMVRGACSTPGMIMSLATLYATEVQSRGMAAWQRSVDLGLCFEMEKNIAVRLGDLLGRWRMFDDGSILEAWEVIDEVGDVMYAMSDLNEGPHETPYVPPDDIISETCCQGSGPNGWDV